MLPSLSASKPAAVIGLLPGVSYEDQSVMLSPGDLLLAYTDGISEAMTEADEEWGEERMFQAAEAVRSLAAEDILRAIFAAADQFTGNAPQHDDMFQHSIRWITI